MKTRFMVLLAKGPSWDPIKLRRAQALWDEHAAFMDKLVADGFVVLGGPLGEGDGDDVLLVIDAADKDTIISTLKDDPWGPAGILEVKAIQRWTIFLDSRER
jgi:uncharacterized protein YciI